MRVGLPESADNEEFNEGLKENSLFKMVLLFLQKQSVAIYVLFSTPP